MSGCPETSPNYEEQFSHRFSAEDKDYQQYLERSLNPPPIVEDWKGRGGGHQRGRDNRFQDQRGRERGRGWGWSGDQRSFQHGHDRRWGQGGGQQQGQQNSYNSYNQRPHYERY